ncbi:RidA family protein [uncultured Ilumatobacter sp.]|jgi:enamine deaminase RidA (YjgF/YER057c/UK114 family)|uniref:RidA family protein n=1 Tax=uncultured Ilumatobacter sp. TaxID=879968 RepID=UPI00374F2342
MKTVTVTWVNTDVHDEPTRARPSSRSDDGQGSPGWTPIATDISSHLPFTPAVEANGFVFVSGQASVDATGAIISGTFEEEMRLSMANVESVGFAASASRQFAHWHCAVHGTSSTTSPRATSHWARWPANDASIRTDAAVELLAGSTALAVCDILWGSIPVIIAARSCRVRMGKQRSACRLSDPAERDLTSVEPDRHRSLIGRQTPGEPARRRQALHEPTRPTTYQTIRTSARINRHLTHKSALQHANRALPQTLFGPTRLPNPPERRRRIDTRVSAPQDPLGIDAVALRLGL